MGDHCCGFDEDPPVWLPWLAGVAVQRPGHSGLAGKVGSSSEVCKEKLGFVLLLLALRKILDSPLVWVRVRVTLPPLEHICLLLSLVVGRTKGLP